MVARTMTAQDPVRLTQENHPENVVEPAAQAPAVSLGAMIAISILSGLIGMTFGTAALSTAFAADGPGEVLSVLLLIAMGTCLLSGWLGAFFWMCREESSHPKP